MRCGKKILGVALPALLAGACAAAGRTAPRPLFEFGPGFDVRILETNDAKATVTQGGTLRVEAGHTAPWPGVTLKAPQGRWDLSPYEHIALEVANRGKEKVTVRCRVDNPGADGTDHCVTDQVAVDPGSSQTLTVRMFPVPWKFDKPLALIGMRGAPVHAGKLDTTNVTQLLLFLEHPKTDCVFEVANIRAGGRVEILDASTFLPFVDELGEYRHKDWPGKTHAAEELATQERAEEEDLKAHTRPENWNKYGGWAEGPKLKGTGFFRVQKHKGKWWLVDPTGKLFWSHGIDCVRPVNATPITDREQYFRNLPANDSPFAQFYGEAAWAPVGYYKDHAPYRTYEPVAQVRRRLRADLCRRDAPAAGKLGRQHDCELVR
jgi:hypothetical protein